VTLRPGVTVVIPTIPPRVKQLARAVRSVLKQTRPPEAFSIEVDRHHEGAGPTRTRAMMRVETEWIAFLDDDDEWYPQHLDHLLKAAEQHQADVVYPWFDVILPGGIKGQGPWPEREGRPFDHDNPYLFPISALVRTELAQRSEFPPMPEPVIGPHGQPENPNWAGDDWPFWCGVFEQGAKVYHLNERTWAYHHGGVSRRGNPDGNTSGRGDRW
jgi:glycosyltransferase involved in cell wall biosynthesis